MRKAVLKVRYTRCLDEEKAKPCLVPPCVAYATKDVESRDKPTDEFDVRLHTLLSNGCHVHSLSPDLIIKNHGDLHGDDCTPDWGARAPETRISVRLPKVNFVELGKCRDFCSAAYAAFGRHDLQPITAAHRQRSDNSHHLTYLQRLRSPAWSSSPSLASLQARALHAHDDDFHRISTFTAPNSNDVRPRTKRMDGQLWRGVVRLENSSIAFGYLTKVHAASGGEIVVRLDSVEGSWPIDDDNRLEGLRYGKVRSPKPRARWWDSVEGRGQARSSTKRSRRCADTLGGAGCVAALGLVQYLVVRQTADRILLDQGCSNTFNRSSSGTQHVVVGRCSRFCLKGSRAELPEAISQPVQIRAAWDLVCLVVASSLSDPISGSISSCRERVGFDDLFCPTSTVSWVPLDSACDLSPILLHPASTKLTTSGCFRIPVVTRSISFFNADRCLRKTKDTPPQIRASTFEHAPREHDVPRSPNTSRPQPPRSMSSASYLQKHRHSTSMTKADVAPPTPAEAQQSGVQFVDFARNSSVRQSPPPVNNLLIPTGAVISPPDSNDNSDGDESEPRGRDLSKNWDQLKEAVRAIDQKRDSSPSKVGLAKTDDALEQFPSTMRPAALTPEARKISHSRSSTETVIIIPRAPTFGESSTTNSDDSDDDGSLHIKPSLVRKKSGELVRPALRGSSRRRYSSMPGTPTYSKSVHFNDNDNQTRHFLQVDKPIAVSAGTSPVESYESESEFPFDGKPEREIKLTEFPADTFERRTRPVRVERIFLSPDKQTLIGSCAVQNIAFHKLVVARFTVDWWKTTSEVVAEYNNVTRSANHDGCDRFNFHIKLSDQANIDDKTLLLCIRYNVGGQDFWDNNNGSNYQVDFVKGGAKRTTNSVASAGLGARPLHALPRSRHTPLSPSHPRPTSLDDDFAMRADINSAYHLGSADSLLGESPTSIKLKPRSKRGSLFPDNGSSPAGNGLGGRYDFGASLSAALGSAQSALGRQSGLMNGKGTKIDSGSYFAARDHNDGFSNADERPEALAATDRPAIGSEQYKDLVSKFCYFTPGTGKLTSSPQSGSSKDTLSVESKSFADNLPTTAGSTDLELGVGQGVLSLDGSSDRASPVPSPLETSPALPAPLVASGRVGRRTTSPISFGYPYHSASRDGFFAESRTPTAIRG
nr:protein phosphatase 1 regulatory subunit 3a [Quercus suber]